MLIVEKEGNSWEGVDVKEEAQLSGVMLTVFNVSDTLG